MSYEGTERRQHRTIVTRNTEYHLKGEVCVAVRDRTSKRWSEGHLAVAKRVEGGVKFYDNGAVVPSLDPLSVGDAMFFTYRTERGDDRQLITSRIEAITRTPKKDVLVYGTLGVKKQRS